jgi:hypothetical protein
MTSLAALTTWADKTHILTVIETPRGSSCQLEFDPKFRVFTFAKPLMDGLTYPYDWASFRRPKQMMAIRWMSWSFTILRRIRATFFAACRLESWRQCKERMAEGKERSRFRNA